MPSVNLFYRAAVVSFVVDTLLQAIALLEDAERSLSSPSALYVAYAPHPYAPIAFFSAGVVLQVHWFLRIHSQPSSHFQPDDSSIDLPVLSERSSSGGVDEDEETEEPNDGTSMLRSHTLNTAPTRTYQDTIQEPAHFPYLPFYILGTMLQGIDATMWLRRRYDYCGALSLVNFTIGVYALFYILGGSKNHRFPRSNVFTHLVVKLQIAVSLLYLWRSWGALDVLPPPGLSEGILTCVFFIFVTLASGPDPTLGIFLTGILASFATGQHTNLGWNLMFGWISVTVLFFSVLDFIVGVGTRRMIFGSPEKKKERDTSVSSDPIPV